MGLRFQDFQAHMLARPKKSQIERSEDLWPTEVPKAPTEAHFHRQPTNNQFFQQQAI